MHLTVPEEVEGLSKDDDIETRWSAEAYFTSPNYQAKKTVFLLFINRLYLISAVTS